MNRIELINAVKRFRFAEVWSGTCGTWVPVKRTAFIEVLRDEKRELYYVVEQVGLILTHRLRSVTDYCIFDL
jgi:hypothetical protein